ncbi:uncharacterized protein LOC115629306 [Scaptodrosophila lebanonensis]|uniref:Uncharacterized protein LOC115629306 n=1 Tax=Drosophila lebanonensis TaxID=7225 RepID=A0A6J2TYK3_DROLE|nr:uncharacterized protein LOC115629306 [Scaptodrosophila lebanonensis]
MLHVTSRLPTAVAALTFTVTIVTICMLASVGGQTHSQSQLDFGNLWEGLSGQTAAQRTSAQLQQKVNAVKRRCLESLNMPLSYMQQTLLTASSATQQEKCLIECILKGAKLMSNNNKLSTRMVSKLAGMASNDNELIMAIAIATAENCNRRVVATEPCEAAFQINRCISREIRNHKIKLMY